MKKSILAVAGIAALAGVIVPFARVDAADQTDELSVKINDACALSYGSTAHVDGGPSSARTGTWSSNKLSVTMANDAVDQAIGSTNFSVTCNNHLGYDVTLGTEALAGATVSTNTIPYSETDTSTTHAKAPAKGTSSWAVHLDGTSGYWVETGGKVDTSNQTVSAHTFTVTYGVGTSATQAADTYGGDAEYTLTAKSS